MKVDPLGEAAYLVRDLTGPAYEWAGACNRASLPGLIEAVASYDTVGLYVDPERFDLHSLASVHPVANGGTNRLHTIPVCYDMGEDLAEVCERLGLTPSQLIDLHSSSAYRCFAVGFCPGFAYLGYLPDALAGLPRKATPRVRIVPGSLAMTGGQTAVYPLVRPGGWWLIGRTPLTLVDVERDYFPIQAGDEVRFVPIDADEFHAREGECL